MLVAAELHTEDGDLRAQGTSEPTGTSEPMGRGGAGQGVLLLTPLPGLPSAVLCLCLALHFELE